MEPLGPDALLELHVEVGGLPVDEGRILEGAGEVGRRPPDRAVDAADGPVEGVELDVPVHGLGPGPLAVTIGPGQPGEVLGERLVEGRARMGTSHGLTVDIVIGTGRPSARAPRPNSAVRPTLGPAAAARSVRSGRLVRRRLDLDGFREGCSVSPSATSAATGLRAPVVDEVSTMRRFSLALLTALCAQIAAAQGTTPDFGDAPRVRPGQLGTSGVFRERVLREDVPLRPTVLEATPGPRLVLDLDWEPDAGRGWFRTLLFGPPRTAENTFFDLPWPLDTRRHEGGAPDLAGLPVPRVTAWFRLPRRKLFLKRAFRIAQREPTGFSPCGPIYLRFDGPVHAPAGGPSASLAEDATVFLVDLDPASPEFLARKPIDVTVTASADSIRPAHLMQILPVPGVPLRPGTRYAAVVLRDLGAPGHAFLGQPPALEALLRGEDPGGARGAALAEAFEPLAAFLPLMDLDPRRVAAATVFTTGDPAARLLRQTAHVARLPPPEVVELETRDAYPEFTALRGACRLPKTQRGFRPYLISGLFGGGRQVVDDAGLPVPLGYDDAEFQLSVPKGRMPAEGFPLYLYVHGTGGLASQAIDRGYTSRPDDPPAPGSGYARTVGRAGWATACVATAFSPSRQTLGFLAGDGYAAYNILNPAAMRDNYIQMVLELVHFRNLLREIRIDPALCPGTDASAAPDGKVRFDPDEVVVGGQSLGSFLAGMLAGALGGFEGVVLSGAGATWIEFPFGPTDPIDLAATLSRAGLPEGETLDRVHPLLAVFDLAVGPADNVHFVPLILRDPPRGERPPHVLVIQGQEDHQVPINTQRALVLALKADLAGPEVGRSPAQQLLPALPWGGLRQLPLPVAGNRAIPGGEPVTAACVRYPGDPVLEDGHYVAFQLDDAKRRVVEFLRAIDRGETPVVR